MKKINLVVVLVFFLTACLGQEGPKVSRGDQSPPKELASVWNDPAGLLKKAQEFYSASNYSLSLTALERILNSFPKSGEYEKANTLAQDVRARLGLTQGKIGVLLPLSGQFTRYGQATLDGISCAFGLFDPCSAGTSKIQMVVKDSGGTGAQALSAVHELIEQEKVAGIIGPLVSAEMNEAINTAQNLGVPIITLAPQKRSAEQSFVFQHTHRPEKEIESLADKSLQEGIRSFIIIYPQNRYGEDVEKFFKERVSSSGAQIVATFGYEADLPSFYDTIQHFVQRPAVAEAIKKQGRNLGIFIPDSYRQVLQIAQSLEKLNVKTPRLLGTSRWHHDSLAASHLAVLEGSIIVTPFFPEAGSAKDFSQAFKQAHGNDPAWLEAIGYDAARMMVKAIEAKGTNPKEVQTYLAGMGNFSGVVGNISLDTQGNSHWPLSFITIHDGAFQNF